MKLVGGAENQQKLAQRFLEAFSSLNLDNLTSMGVREARGQASVFFTPGKIPLPCNCHKEYGFNQITFNERGMYLKGI